MKKKIIIGVILIILIAAISVSAAFIVNKQNESRETNLSNAEEQPKNEETENLTNLGDVAQIGDYVNYMGSDTDWRVINILDGYQNEKDKIVYLIYSSYLVDDYEDVCIKYYLNDSNSSMLDSLKEANEKNEVTTQQIISQVIDINMEKAHQEQTNETEHSSESEELDR